MSVRLMADVFADSDTSGNDRVVLLALADEADDDGTNCYPSQRRIATKARISLSTTRRCIDRLVEAGEIVVVHAGGDGRGDVTKYQLTRGKGSQTEHLVDDHEGGQSDSLAHARKVPKGATSVRKSKQTHRPVTTTTKNGGASHPVEQTLLDVRGNVDVVFDAWRESTHRQRTVLDAKRRRFIIAALKLYPVEDVIDAVKGWQHSPHHRGENERRTIYNDIELLLRDAAHIEKFRDLQRGGPSTTAGPRMSRSRQNLDNLTERMSNGSSSRQGRAERVAGQLSPGTR